MRNKIYSILVVCASVLIVSALVVKAGSLTPPSGSPSAKFYTLSEIYARLTTNATATEGTHSFAFSDSLAGMGKTLTEIYSAIPTITANTVKLNTSYLGVAGTLVPSGGDASIGNVLIGKTFFGLSQADWALQTGTMANNGSFTLVASLSNQNVTPGYYSGGTLTGDADLTTGNIKSGINIFRVVGDSNVVNTSLGDAIIGDILSGKKAYVGGSLVTGNIANCGSEGSQTCYATGTYYAGTSKTVSNSTTSQSAGYYPAFNLATLDTDLVAANIGANANIFGVAGTLLKNQYNGSATSGATDYTFWTQALGGVDDYNDGQAAFPTGSYVGSWTDCTSGADNYCGLGATDTNADAKDLSTGLIWSVAIGIGADYTQSWFWANSCYPPETPTYNPGVCASHGDDGCQCVKLPVGSKTGCDALGDGGWRLPYQKELMQAYIDGSWTNLTSGGYIYWSSTTDSYYTPNAWIVYLYYGYTYGDLNTYAASYRVRCVRQPAPWPARIAT